MQFEKNLFWEPKLLPVNQYQSGGAQIVNWLWSSGNIAPKNFILIIAIHDQYNYIAHKLTTFSENVLKWRKKDPWKKLLQDKMCLRLVEKGLLKKW